MATKSIANFTCTHKHTHTQSQDNPGNRQIVHNADSICFFSTLCMCVLSPFTFNRIGIHSLSRACVFSLTQPHSVGSDRFASDIIRTAAMMKHPISSTSIEFHNFYLLDLLLLFHFNSFDVVVVVVVILIEFSHSLHGMHAYIGIYSANFRCIIECAFFASPH